MPISVTPKDLVSVDISISEGDPFWKCDLIVSSPEEFLKFSPNDKFVILLGSEEYHFYVESASLNKSGPVEMSGSVKGVGLGVDLDYPRKKTYSKVYGESLASAIVDDLLGTRVSSWDLVDWIVPADRFGIMLSSRVTAASQLVEAVGGVLEGTPDGNFVVRSKWPISPWKYEEPGVIVDHTFDEQNAVFSANFDYSLTKYLDTVTVMDLPLSSQRDRVEVIEDPLDPLRKIVRVYPSPYRETFILDHTSDPDKVTITLVGTVFREEVEVIEIVNGQGTAKYPVFEILNVQWMTLSLISLFCDPFSDILYSSHESLKYSLARVRYKVKCIEYIVTSATETDVQFLIIDP